jgi:hypothetical protein
MLLQRFLGSGKTVPDEKHQISLWARIYPDRTAAGHRYYRHPGGAAFSRIGRREEKVQVHRAKLQMAQMVMAISGYESAYGRLPASSEAMNGGMRVQGDFTYGTYGNSSIKLPNGAAATVDVSGNYHTNNAEVMAIVMDLVQFRNNVPTINKDHVKNPNRTSFLPAKEVSDVTSAGVGLDGAYRDPWGNPYIITLDLNSDGKARDAFYSMQTVSEDSNSSLTPRPGLNGLIRTALPDGTVVFEANSPIMVWSAGPDKMIDTSAKANAGANSDNVLSWK